MCVVCGVFGQHVTEPHTYRCAYEQRHLCVVHLYSYYVSYLEVLSRDLSQADLLFT